MVAYGTYEVTGVEGPLTTIKGPWVGTFVKKGETWYPLTHGSSMKLPPPAPPKK